MILFAALPARRVDTVRLFLRAGYVTFSGILKRAAISLTYHFIYITRIGVRFTAFYWPRRALSIGVRYITMRPLEMPLASNGIDSTESTPYAASAG